MSLKGLNVDTELPDPAALSDATPNPTAPMVGAAGMVYDAAATVWKRQVQAKPTWDLHTYNGVAAGVQLLAQDDTYLRPQKIAASVADGDTGTYHGVTSPRLYNGASFDRERGNTEGTLLASAARTGNSLTAIQTNHNARGVILTLACTAKAGSTLIRPYLGVIDPATTYYSTIGAFSTGKDVSPGPNLMMLTCYPGAVGTETGFSLQFHETIQQPLPRTWFAYVEHGDSDSITYSLSYQLIL